MLFELIHTPACSVLRSERWNAPPGRWFTAYRARNGFRWLMGNGVVDEYATISSPVFLGARGELGKIYNAGISLGHKRDPDMALDLGWPPLCIGLDRPAAEPAAGWEQSLLEAIEAKDATSTLPDGIRCDRAKAGGFEFERWHFGREVSVIATGAPLLPQQLARVCDAEGSPLSVAVAMGNRITRQEDLKPQDVQAASEELLAAVIARASAA